MVISKANRYVFIEVPQTASTAVAVELIVNYQGRRILRRHSDYGEFFRTASTEEKQYRVLATIRNPLDIIVSKFVKARDKHGELYGEARLPDAPWGYRFRQEARELAFIEKHGHDFEAFVRKFCKRIYNSRACLLPPHAHVLRYERLNDDFAAWLQVTGLQMIRPLPRTNTTEGRERDFVAWYPPGIRSHAARVFGPYLMKWGYELPGGWPEIEPSTLDRLMFRVDTILREFYFRHLHYGWIVPRARNIKHIQGR